MSIFNIFKSSNEEEQSYRINWVKLQDLGQLNEIMETSREKPVLIFKHSTRCSVSRMALKQFENEYTIPENEATPYFLDLIAFRDVSNEIANRFSVTHQSPQLLLIKDGKSVYDVSHSEIDAVVLRDKL